MADAVLGPGFEAVEEGAVEFGEFGEGEVGEGVFAGVDGLTLDLDEVDDAEVDLADGIGVVVEEGDDAVGVGEVEDEFLVEFAFDGGAVGVGAGAAFAGVDRVDVAADADGAEGVEAGLAAGFAAGVVEDAGAGADDAVGDELLVGGVFLGGGAVHEEVVGGVEQRGDGGVEEIGFQALEGAEGIEDGAGDDEDLFTGVFGHARKVGERARRGGGKTVGGEEEPRRGVDGCGAWMGRWGKVAGR